ncbi:MAG: hypothetical protein IKC94_00490 [Lentisphaeria bacterium]|nr:hypothetical protein [Lentisphaeria bacterium]
MNGIFDVNISCGRWPFRRLPDSELPELAAVLKNFGIHGGIVRSLEAPFSMNINEENEILLKRCDGMENFIPAVAVRPEFGLWREVSGKVAALYPSYHQYSLFAPETLEMISGLLAKDIVPLIVIREEDERGQNPLCKVAAVPADEINELAKMFPEKPFIAVNAYAWEYSKFTAENLYVDIAFAEAFPALAGAAAETVGPGRLVFGSHAPFFCVGAEVSKLSYSKFSKEDVKNISYKNMERILYGK